MFFLCLTATWALIIQGRHSTVHALSFGLQPSQIPSFFAGLSGNNARATFTYTHLEGNGQLWQANSGATSVSLVVDPLASQLDFGVPWGYRANKKALSEQATIDLICDAQPSHCLLTMGLDDHTHLPTIEKLMEKIPSLKYVVAPSAEKKLVDAGVKACFITVLRHGESCNLIEGANVLATQGALVGPPWQMRENGFLLRLNSGNEKHGANLSVYYEPHADVILESLQNMKMRADIIVSPVTKQSLPARAPKEGQFTLVYGGDRTLKIAETLGAQVVVPLVNGALDIEGPLATLVEASGDVQEFERLVDERNEKEVTLKREYAKLMKVVHPMPGVPLKVSL
ncbi:hypothetical protein ACHAW6_005294 [Cyclotella cf. meneghiniana]